MDETRNSGPIAGASTAAENSELHTDQTATGQTATGQIATGTSDSQPASSAASAQQLFAGSTDRFDAVSSRERPSQDHAHPAPHAPQLASLRDLRQSANTSATSPAEAPSLATAFHPQSAQAQKLFGQVHERMNASTEKRPLVRSAAEVDRGIDSPKRELNVAHPEIAASASAGPSDEPAVPEVGIEAGIAAGIATVAAAHSAVTAAPVTTQPVPMTQPANQRQQPDDDVLRQIEQQAKVSAAEFERVRKAIDGVPSSQPVVAQPDAQPVSPPKRLGERLAARKSEIDASVALGIDVKSSMEPSVSSVSAAPATNPLSISHAAPVARTGHQMPDEWQSAAPDDADDMDVSELHGWLQEKRSARSTGSRNALLAAGVTFGILFGAAIAYVSSQGGVGDLLASKRAPDAVAPAASKAGDKFLKPRPDLPAIQPTALSRSLTEG